MVFVWQNAIDLLGGGAKVENGNKWMAVMKLFLSVCVFYLTVQGFVKMPGSLLMSYIDEEWFLLPQVSLGFAQKDAILKDNKSSRGENKNKNFSIFSALSFFFFCEECNQTVLDHLSSVRAWFPI